MFSKCYKLDSQEVKSFTTPSISNYKSVLFFLDK
jgi:hypothetical protein